MTRNSWTPEHFWNSERYFCNDVMVCLGSVPRGHTSDVRFIFECYFAKEGKTFSDNLRFVKDIWIFPDEHVFRQSIYRRKRFTSCWRRVLSQKRAEECAGRYIVMEGRMFSLIVLFHIAHGSSFGKGRSPGFLIGKENSSKCFHIPSLLSGSNYKSFKTRV